MEDKGLRKRPQIKDKDIKGKARVEKCGIMIQTNRKRHVLRDFANQQDKENNIAKLFKKNFFLLFNRPFSIVSKVSVRPMCLSAGLCVTNHLRSHNTSRISCQRSLPAARNNSQQQPANLLQGNYAANTKLTFAFMSSHVPLNIPSLCFFFNINLHTQEKKQAWSYDAPPKK